MRVWEILPICCGAVAFILVIIDTWGNKKK